MESGRRSPPEVVTVWLYFESNKNVLAPLSILVELAGPKSFTLVFRFLFCCHVIKHNFKYGHLNVKRSSPLAYAVMPKPLFSRLTSLILQYIMLR